jgi:RNA polymerase sigma-32 factor
MMLVVTLVRRNTLKPMESPKDKRDPDEPASQGSGKLPELVDEASSERQPGTPHLPEDSSETALIRPTALQLYLSKIGRYPVLSPEEEHKLAVQYLEEDDREAAYRLVTSNLRLVVKIALEFQRTWMNNLLDLIQEGNVGLMQAVKKFDPYRGIRLSSYASFWIKAYILKFILDNWRLVKIGKTQAERKLFYNLYKEKEKLHQLGYDPGPKLIAQRLNVKEEEVIRMDQRLGSWEVSLEKPIKEDASSKSIRDLLPGTTKPQDERLGDEQLRALVGEKLQEFRETLEGREREIFDERLMAQKPLTLKELGDRYGITKERTRQLEVRLLERIREYLIREIPDAEQIIPAFLSSIGS